MYGTLDNISTLWASRILYNVSSRIRTNGLKWTFGSGNLYKIACRCPGRRVFSLLSPSSPIRFAVRSERALPAALHPVRSCSALSLRLLRASDGISAQSCGVPTDHKRTGRRSRSPGAQGGQFMARTRSSSSLVFWFLPTSSVCPGVFQTWPAHGERWGRGGELVMFPGWVHGAVRGATSSPTAAGSPREEKKSIAPRA